jgi:transposase
MCFTRDGGVDSFMYCISFRSFLVFTMGRHKMPKVRKAQSRNDKVADKDKFRMTTEFEDGISITKIAANTNRNYKTVKNIIDRYTKEGSLDRKPGSGRVRSTTKQTDRAIGILVKRNRQVSLREIRKQLELTISDRTISERVFEQTGFESFKAIRNSELQPNIIKSRECRRQKL